MPQQLQSQPGIRDMAKRLSLSMGTISKALNGRPGVGSDTRRRVMKAARQFGYVPDRSAQIMRRWRSRCIQLQLPTLTDLNYAEKMDGIHRAAARHGYEVAVTTFERDRTRREHLCRNAIAQRMEGMILMGGPGGVPMQMMRDAGMAMLLVDPGPTAPPDVACLDTDIAEGMRQIVRHLVQLGHRRFVTSDHLVKDPRYNAGLASALREGGLPEDGYRLIQTDPRPPIMHEMYDRTLEMFGRDRHAGTAVMCVNDQAAIGVITALRELGLSVPGDVSVTGAGNIDIARFYNPALTTASATHLHMGEHAVEMMMSIIKGESPADMKRTLPLELVVRQSTGPANEAQSGQESSHSTVTGGSSFSGGLS